MSGTDTHRILVVDDERSMREFLEILLTGEGYEVSLAVSGDEAFGHLENERFDLVISDIRMKDIDGIQVLKKAKGIDSNTVVVMISAFASAESAVEAMKEGAYDYIPKPFKVREFKRIVRDCLRAGRAGTAGQDKIQEGGYLHFGCLVGESPQMNKVYDLVERVAQTRSNILVYGESGTGKELVARAIHSRSVRSDKPFVVINCAGIPESLIESELFGYRKGAFTGAAADKNGLFDAAHGGTVFFDEIGELPPAIQVKLLRVIQERTFTAVGGTDEKRVDVRFISATNKELESEVIDKRFREDLYFRLNVIQISMPPLRDRLGDIALLARHFLEKYSRDLGKDVKKISAYAMDILQQYSFPGNVRELENIIERSVALEASNIVLPESLTLSHFKQQSKAGEGRKRRTDLTSEGIHLDTVLEEIQREYISQALELSRGSRQKAAELLGITPDSLKYRLSKLSAKPE